MHAVNWFEIPVADLDRACRFYESVLGVTLKREVFGGERIAVFPVDGESVGGALVQGPRRLPSSDGTRVYLNASGQLEPSIARVTTAGGAVLLPRTDIGPPGFIAVIQDPEGNSVGLHAPR